MEERYNSVQGEFSRYIERICLRPGLLTWAGYESAFRNRQKDKEFTVHLVEYILGLGKLDARSIYTNERKVFISIFDDELLKQPKGLYSRNLLVFSMTNKLETSGKIYWQSNLGTSLTDEYNLSKINLTYNDLVRFAWEESEHFGNYLFG